MEKIRLGISACLLGERVRYDGQHKLDTFLRDTLGAYVTYVPVCPEVECGLPVPREAMRLVGDTASPRLVTTRTGRDLTGQMLPWDRQRAEELAAENLSGFIFKAKSPSSGMERVKVYNEKGGPAGSGSGLFAAAFMRRFPMLPVEDEGRLHDPGLRENFIERIFTLHRYRDAAREASMHALMSFHARHKFLFMAHGAEGLREMGRLLATTDRSDLADVGARYEGLLLKHLKRLATPRRHANVLQHALGYLRKLLTADEKQEMLDLIDAFKQGLLPLIVPVTLLTHYARRYDVAYLRSQVYLHPHPLELKLRNHA